MLLENYLNLKKMLQIFGKPVNKNQDLSRNFKVINYLIRYKKILKFMLF